MLAPTPPDPHQAVLGAELIEDAYQASKGTLDPAGKFRFRNLPGRLQYAYQDSEGVVTLAVPGTNEVPDWLINLNPRLARIHGSPGKFRRGWQRMAERLVSDFEHVLRQAATQKVYVYGHSLGAGVATHCLAYLATRGWAASVGGAVMFAPPSSVNRKAAKWLESIYGDRIVNVIHAADIVPQIIPAIRLVRPGRVIYIDHDGQEETDYSYWRELRQAIRQPGIQSIGDHAMRWYMRWARRAVSSLKSKRGGP